MRDAALLMLDTGLRVAEVLALEWRDVYFEPIGGAKFGFIHGPKGKSLNAKRNLSLMPHGRVVLETRHASRKLVWVSQTKQEPGSAPVYTLEAQHKHLMAALRLPADAVIHSFRYTFGRRLGETGADGFSIMQAMGHSTVVVSQKHVCPLPEAIEWAFERLNAPNEQALASLLASPKAMLAEYGTDAKIDAGELAETRHMQQAL